MKQPLYNSEQGRVSKMRKRIRKIGEMPKELLTEIKRIRNEANLQNDINDCNVFKPINCNYIVQSR